MYPFRLKLAARQLLLLYAAIVLPGSLALAEPLAEEGILDLRQADWERIHFLDGKWAFYWNRLVNPLELRSPDRAREAENAKITEKPDAFAEVPDDWLGLEVKGTSLPGSGYATYYLRVLLPEEHPPLSLKFLDQSSAYSLYVNGKLYGENGQVSTSTENYLPSYRTRLYELQEKGEVLDIVIHVANYGHRKGGLWERIHIGPQDKVRQFREGRIVFEEVVEA